MRSLFCQLSQIMITNKIKAHQIKSICKSSPKPSKNIVKKNVKKIAWNHLLKSPQNIAQKLPKNITKKIDNLIWNTERVQRA